MVKHTLKLRMKQREENKIMKTSPKKRIDIISKQKGITKLKKKTKKNNLKKRKLIIPKKKQNTKKTKRQLKIIRFTK